MRLSIDSFSEVESKDYATSLSRFAWLTSDFETCYSFGAPNFALATRNCFFKITNRSDKEHPDTSFCSVINDCYTEAVHLKFLNDDFKIAAVMINEEYPVAIMIMKGTNAKYLELYGVKDNPFNPVYKEIFPSL